MIPSSNTLIVPVAPSILPFRQINPARLGPYEFLYSFGVRFHAAIRRTISGTVQRSVPGARSPARGQHFSPCSSELSPAVRHCGLDQADTAQISGRSHANDVFERTIQSSSRHFASSTQPCHRSTDQTGSSYGISPLTHYCTGTFVGSERMRPRLRHGCSSFRGGSVRGTSTVIGK
jgi:hypothetical protein